MMASTNQIDLLKVLGVGATRWTFVPALIASSIAVRRSHPNPLMATDCY